LRSDEGSLNIGLIGGMSWESTVPYYRLINETVREQRGGLHSARIVLYSVDFHDVEAMQRTGRWSDAGDALAQAAVALEGAGADFLVLCTNTMHKVAAAIERAVRIPLLHIADPTADAVKAAGVHTIGLLGTRFTMEEDFYRERLRALHGLDVVVPDSADRDAVHRIIYDELCMGRVVESSRAHYRSIVERLVARGAAGIILGCTEISMLLGPADASVPTFDTTLIHARAAALRAMAAVNRPATCEEPSP
jgi:aspartate racemase